MLPPATADAVFASAAFVEADAETVFAASAAAMISALTILPEVPLPAESVIIRKKIAYGGTRNKSYCLYFAKPVCVRTCCD